MEHIGKVVQILGPVLDIRFQPNEVPTILNAIRVESEEGAFTEFIISLPKKV